MLFGLISGSAYGLSPEEVKALLVSVRPDLLVQKIVPSSLKGFYEVRLNGGQILYSTEDGQHFFAGDLYRVTPKELVNLTENDRTKVRKEIMDGIDESEMLVFSPEIRKASITVFTDVDCGYCRKLHREVPELMRMGIAVRYLAYPRAGINSPSYDKIVSAWCAEDPQLAITKAKLGQEIPEKTCDNPVAKHFRLGQEIGVTGTPALVFEDGRLLPGYLSAAALAAELGIN